MVNKDHTYKVVNRYGVIYVTYDDFQKAWTFRENAAKNCGITLFIKEIKQDKTHGKP